MSDLIKIIDIFAGFTKKRIFVHKILIMRLIGKLVVFLALASIVQCANSQPPIDTLSTSVILMESDITLEEDEAGISIDSLMFLVNNGMIDSMIIPAAELYGYIWSNQLVNPYGQRVIDMPDTICIDFSQYYHANKNVVTSDFGFRKGWRFHYGIDTRLKIGDSICTSFDGMVRIVKRGKAYGNYVVIRHFNGLETVYAHLSKTFVKDNQVVRAGEVIALGGNTGRSTGPHLHYEIRYLGQPIPPRELIDFETYAAKTKTVNLCAGHFAYAQELEKIRYYTVRKGDTLYGISLKTGVSMDKLCALNKIKKSSILRIGQKIRYT